jgi:hypothetical protein
MIREKEKENRGEGLSAVPKLDLKLKVLRDNNYSPSWRSP